MPEPLVHREPVRPDWIDYNGHLSEAYYVLVMGHATDGVMAAVGIDAEHRAVRDASLYTVEAHVRYLAEVPGGATVEVRSSVIGRSAKLLHLWHELWVDDRLRATEEILGVYVSGGRAAPLPADVAARVDALRVEPPADAGHAVVLESGGASPRT